MSLQEKYAAEHKRFLEENNPSVLRGLSDPTSYLSSVGEQAAERYEDLMFRHRQSPEVQKLPHHQMVRELQSRHHEVEELIRRGPPVHRSRWPGEQKASHRNRTSGLRRRSTTREVTGLGSSP
jgi:hypothetical protein